MFQSRQSRICSPCSAWEPIETSDSANIQGKGRTLEEESQVEVHIFIVEMSLHSTGRRRTHTHEEAVLEVVRTMAHSWGCIHLACEIGLL